MGYQDNSVPQGVRAFRSRKGNIFAMLFAAVAMTGVLGIVGMQTVTGPVTTITKVTQKNITDTDVMTNGRIVILNAVTRDALEDGDPEIEPAPYVVCDNAPTGGGCLPPDIGAVQTDPWGTSYGYCVWNHGQNNTATTGMLQGSTDGSGAVIAIISAGPNKVFETGCYDYDGTEPEGLSPAPRDGMMGGGDDSAKFFTYAEAAAGADGLWTLKLGTTETATVDAAKGVVDFELGTGANMIRFDTATGRGEFPSVRVDVLTGHTQSNIEMAGGLRLDDQSGVTECDTGATGVIRYNTGGYMQLCDGSNFVRLSPWQVDSGDNLSYNAGNVSVGQNMSVTGNLDAGATTVSSLTATGTISGGSLTTSGTLNAGTSTLGSTTTDNLTVTGNTSLGDDISDSVTVSGNTSIARNLTVGSNVLSADVTSSNVGIGTASPDFQGGGARGLHISDSVSPAIRFEEGTANYYIGLDGSEFYFRPNGLGTTDALTLTQTGRVIVHGGSSNVALDVIGLIRVGTGTCSTEGTIQYNTTTKIIEVCDGNQWKSASGIDKLGDIGDVNVPTPAQGSLLSWDTLTDRWVAINSSGVITGGSNSAKRLEDTGKNTKIDVDTAGDGSDDTIVFTNNDNQSMIITAGGRVGIGLSEPQSLLHVAGGIQLGNDGDSCPGVGGVKQGALRYDGASLQICNASGWTNVGTGGGSSGGNVMPSVSGVMPIITSGSLNKHYTNYVTLPRGVYLAHFYNCLSGAADEYYVQTRAEASSGSISTHYVNRNYSQMEAFTQPSFPFYVFSDTANVRFVVFNPSNPSLTLTETAVPTSKCSAFYYHQVNTGVGDGGSGGGGATDVSFHAYQTSDQTLTPGSPSYTKMNFQATEFNTGDFNLATGRFQPKVPGKYLLTFATAIKNVPAGGTVEAGIYKNGTPYAWGTAIPSGETLGNWSVATTIVEANGTTDYFEAYTWVRNNTTSLTTIGTPGRSHVYFTGSLLNGGGSGGSGGSGGEAKGMIAHISANQTIPYATTGVPTTTAVFGLVSKDDFNGLNPATGVFTAPESGWYQLSSNVQWVGFTDANQMSGLRIVAAGGSACWDFGTGSSTDKTQNCSSATYMSAGDTAHVDIWHYGRATETIEAGRFSIVKINGAGGTGGSGGGTQTVPIVLSSGEKSGAIDLTETITIAQDGVLHLTGNVRGGNFPLTQLYVNGTLCGIDRSYVAGTTNQYASAACTMDLPAGTHTIRSIYGETSGSANFYSNRMSWSVIAKNITVNTGGGSGVDGGGEVIAFVARPDGSQNLAHATYTDVLFAVQEHETGGDNFNPTTGKFVAPSDGYYQFNAAISIQDASPDPVMLIQTEHSGTTGKRICTVRDSRPNEFTSIDGVLSCSGVAYLTAGTAVEVIAYQNSGVARAVQNVSTFSGFKIQGGGTGNGSGSGGEAEISFRAHGGNNTVANSTWTDIVNNTVTHNKGNHYNPATGKFTVPSDGTYVFHGSAYFNSGSSNTGRYGILIQKESSSSNGQNICLHLQPALTMASGPSCSGLIELTAGEVIEVSAYQETGSNLTLAGNTYTNFSGFKIGSGGAGSGGSITGGWENVLLSDTANFDVSCEYRATVSGSVVLPMWLSGGAFSYHGNNSAYSYRISATNKTRVDRYDIGTNTLSEANTVSVTSIEKNCGYSGSVGGGSGSGGSGSGGQDVSIDVDGFGKSIPQSTWTTIDFDAKSKDTNNNFDLASNRFTPTVAGKYLVTLNVTCLGVNANQWCSASVNKNTHSIAHDSGYANQNGANLYQSVSRIIDMNGSTDYITASVSNSHTSPMINANMTASLLNGGGSGGGGSADLVAFQAIVSNAQTIPDNTWTKVVFNAENTDFGDNYNPATGNFTVPETGFYQFNLTTSYTSGIPDHTQSVVKINGGAGICYTQEGSGVTIGTDSCSGARYLNAGDIIIVETYQKSGGAKTLGGATMFSGFKVSAGGGMGGGSDNLGSHTATQDLNMATYKITDAGAIELESIMGLDAPVGVSGGWSGDGDNTYRVAGNVGVGSAAPAHKLVVREDAANDITSYFYNAKTTGNKYQGIRLSTSSGPSPARQYADLVVSSQDSKNLFGISVSSVSSGLALSTQNDATLRFVVTGDGNVGIGTTEPMGKLTISGSTSSSGPAGNFANYSILLFTHAGAPNSSYGLGMESSHMWLNSGGGYKFYSGGTHVATIAASTGAYSQVSDLRLKENITPVQDALDKIAALDGVAFRWKNNDKGNDIGLIAQNVRDVFPELVHEDDQGMLTVNYANLVSPLIEAVKELKKTNDRMADRLDAIDGGTTGIPAWLLILVGVQGFAIIGLGVVVLSLIRKRK